MPFDPTTPRSRDEVLLQAIVSGDSSKMGEPRDREEEFVKAIADKETLPDYSEASEGDVLQIGTDGPEWTTPSAVSPLYEHHIVIRATGSAIPNWYVCVTMLSTVSTPATNQATFNAIYATEAGILSCSGFRTASGKTSLVFGLDKGASSVSTLSFHVGELDAATCTISTDTTAAVTFSYLSSISDTVSRKE